MLARWHKIFGLLVFSSALNAREIEQSLLNKLVQEFVNIQYKKSFLYLGDENDFDHGHVLYTREPSLNSPDRLRAFAILFHTQEHAFTYSLSHPKGKYSYIDKFGRNWVQFFDESTQKLGPLLNAYTLVKNMLPNNERNQSSLENLRTHYTIRSEMLDEKKFPVAYRFSVDFEKMYVFSKDVPAEFSWTPFKIQLASDEVKLHLYSTRLSENYVAEAPCTLVNDAIPPKFAK